VVAVAVVLTLVEILIMAQQVVLVGVVHNGLHKAQVVVELLVREVQEVMVMYLPLMVVVVVVEQGQ
jgi:hypothetical protein